MLDTTPKLGPADRATELAYLGFLLADSEAEIYGQVLLNLSIPKSTL